MNKNDCKELKETVVFIVVWLQTANKIANENNKNNNNHENAVLFTGVVPWSLSNHGTIACVRKINLAKYENQTMKCQNYKN